MNLPAPRRLRRTQPLLSVVVPVFNEAAILPEFFKKISVTLNTLDIATEIIFVDDGSDDGSSEVVARLGEKDTRVASVKLSRNFGKEAAMTAGLAHAQGDAIVLIDADLQDPPEEIPRMLAAWQNGGDVVAMQRRHRAGESWLKRASASAFYRLFAKISDTPVPVDTGDFRLLSRRVVDVLLALPERQRYMKALFVWPGFKQVVLRYDRDARVGGESKFNWIKLIGLAMDGITSFSAAPLRLATIVGSFLSLTAFVFALIVIVKTLLLGETVPGYPSLIVCMLMLGGVQLLAIGLLGEYVGRLYIEAKQRPLYVVENFRASQISRLASELKNEAR